jgi:hypothetical protein
VRRVVALTIATLAALAPPALAVPRVAQLVVFRNGHSREARPTLAQTTVNVHGRRCTVGSATPLAALVHSGIGPLSLRDYGSCSKRASDAGGLFVSGIGTDRNRGSDGWVYKVGNVLATAGAADPAGPFGRGRLRNGAYVTWFWCHVSSANGGCPHTLGLTVSVSGRTLLARVRQYNDGGKGRPDSQVTVQARNGNVVQTAQTGAGGSASLTLGPGSYVVSATKAGRIASFSARVRVK